MKVENEITVMLGALVFLGSITWLFTPAWFISIFWGGIGGGLIAYGLEFSNNPKP